MLQACTCLLPPFIPQDSEATITKFNLSKCPCSLGLRKKIHVLLFTGNLPTPAKGVFLPGKLR